MTMMGSEPLRELARLANAMNRLFEDTLLWSWGLWPELGLEELALDIYETSDVVVVKAAPPGVKPEEVDISITGDTLTIRGERNPEHDVKEED